MHEDVIRAHAELPSLCEHIHLPLQSGSTPVLKRMRRTYSRERYLDRVALIREHVPDCALTTDIIVGFPGETEHDFEQTLEVCEQVGYDGAFTFIYSPRRETEAAEMDDQVPHELKVERMERLVEVVQRRARERAQRFVGRTLEVLVEGPRGPIRAACAAARATTRSSTSRASASPATSCRCEITAATSQTLMGEASLLCARRAAVSALGAVPAFEGGCAVQRPGASRERARHRAAREGRAAVNPGGHGSPGPRDVADVGRA